MQAPVPGVLFLSQLTTQPPTTRVPCRASCTGADELSFTCGVEAHGGSGRSRRRRVRACGFPDRTAVPRGMQSSCSHRARRQRRRDGPLWIGPSIRGCHRAAGDVFRSPFPGPKLRRAGRGAGAQTCGSFCADSSELGCGGIQHTGSFHLTSLRCGRAVPRRGNQKYWAGWGARSFFFLMDRGI